ncbi:uncharacterized protein LTR77_005270 [Saxophila tyrrhenica]|uniref:RNA 3'-terminal phosphate cyclase domain-containing protein n=1 Tax=Saxophila tyrrhenica TaxID=1690608 RepID=A0AAV9PC76_9PEZI|nr:hypothetical protein LTR77_005270 [Saxophila tyrrhenica]
MEKAPGPIDLDGRTHEGGGQLLRNAVCLAALTGRPIMVHHIRGNRSGGGGLKAQHLACVNWLAEACGAAIEGAEKGSKTLIFEPQDPSGAPNAVSKAFKLVTRDGEAVYETRLDIGTSGATGLALQAILPYILFSPSRPTDHPVRLTLTGGTNVSGSPSFEYIDNVLVPTLYAIGLPDIRATLKKRGWSQGGSTIGEITFDIPARPYSSLPAFKKAPKDPNTKTYGPLHLEATFVGPASVHDYVRQVLPPAISHHFSEHIDETQGTLHIKCEGSLHEKRIYLIILAMMPDEGYNPGNTYQLACDWLYDRKITSIERAATEMVERVANSLAQLVDGGASADEHLCDQLVIFQALAKGTSRVYPGVDEADDPREPSLHQRTAEWVAKKILGAKFDGDNACEGIGFGAEADDKKLKEAQSKERHEDVKTEADEEEREDNALALRLKAFGINGPDRTGHGGSTMPCSSCNTDDTTSRT